MFRSQWLLKVLGSADTLNDRRQTLRHRHNVRLALEILENRLVPSGSNLGPQIENPVDKVAVDASLGVNSVFYSPKSQTIVIAASVKDITNPNRTVYKGTVAFSVTFTPANGKTVVIASGEGVPGKSVPGYEPSPSVALAQITIPPGEPVGEYDIKVKYNDPSGSFKDNGDDKKGKLNVTRVFVEVAAKSQQIVYSNFDQSVTLKAAVTNLFFSKDPARKVNEGIVTFSLTPQMGNPIIDKEAVNVEDGAAILKVTIPAKTPAGKYTISFSYKDTPANYVDSSNSPQYLTITPQAANPKANKVGLNFNPNPQTVTVSAGLPHEW